MAGIKIIDCESWNNGGDGIRIEGDGDVTVMGTSVHDNGGHGVRIRSEMAAVLSRRFPVLEGAEESLFEDLLAQAKTNDGKITESFLRSTALGRWLESQSFVDWAQLAAALVGLLPKA